MVGPRARLGDRPVRARHVPCVKHSLMVAALALVGCGPGRPSGSEGANDAGQGTDASEGNDASHSASGAGDAGTATASDGSDGDSGSAPEVCKDGWTFCEECTLLSADHANCGECGRVCSGSPATRSCRNGQCEPGSWPCVTPDQGAATCDDACATVGQTCSDNAETCGGGVLIWLTDSANDNSIEDDLESCARQVGADTSEQQPCNAPIPWDLVILGRTVVGVACCCTQD